MRMPSSILCPARIKNRSNYLGALNAPNADIAPLSQSSVICIKLCMSTIVAFRDGQRQQHRHGHSGGQAIHEFTLRNPVPHRNRSFFEVVGAIESHKEDGGVVIFEGDKREHLGGSVRGF
jgi:hypothetical protein